MRARVFERAGVVEGVDQIALADAQGAEVIDAVIPTRAVDGANLRKLICDELITDSVPSVIRGKSLQKAASALPKP